MNKLIEVLKDASVTIEVALDMLDFSERPSTQEMMRAMIKRIDDAVAEAEKVK
jgi:hypothetical protein